MISFLKESFQKKKFKLSTIIVLAAIVFLLTALPVYSVLGNVAGFLLPPETDQRINIAIEDDKEPLRDGYLTSYLDANVVHANQETLLKLAETIIDEKKEGEGLTIDEAMTALVCLLTTQEDLETLIISSLLERESQSIAKTILGEVDPQIIPTARLKGQSIADLLEKTQFTIASLQTNQLLADMIEDSAEIEKSLSLIMTDEFKQSLVKKLVSASLQEPLTDLNTHEIVGNLLENNQATEQLILAIEKELLLNQDAQNIIWGPDLKMGFPYKRQSQEVVFQINAEGPKGAFNIPLEDIDFKSGSVVMSLNPNRQFTPGSYELKIEIKNPVTGKNEILRQNFAWGVLSMNSDQDVYELGQQGQLDIGVLNNQGRPVCNAELSMQVTSPSGHMEKIDVNNTGACTLFDSQNQQPDYMTSYDFDEIGEYQFKLTATTNEGTRSITSVINVFPSADFIVKRNAATRLFPKGNAPMEVEIVFNKDFSGVIHELLPASFELSQLEPETYVSLSESGDTKIIHWPVDVKAGETKAFLYQYDAPNVSPEFYVIGGMKFFDTSGQLVHQESRAWQIANDVLPAPGAVDSNIEMWLKADSGVTNTGDRTDATNWQDQVNNYDFNHAELASGTFPTYYANGMNGNPYLDWDNNTDRLGVGPVEFNNIPTTDFFIATVYLSQSLAGRENLFQYSTRDQVGGQDDEIKVTVENDNSMDSWLDGGVLSTGTDINSDNGTPHIMTNRRLDDTHSIVFDGEFQVSHLRAQALVTGGCLVLGGDSVFDQCDGFTTVTNYNGDLAEFVMYSAYPSDLEQLKIHSYLALKYGIHMGDDTDGDDTPREIISGAITEGDYVLAADNTIVFDVSDNGSMTEGIAGIGRDDDSDLDQLSSRSTQEEGIARMADATSQDDGDYLTWAHNGGENLWSDTEGPAGYRLLQRQWRAQETGDIGTVDIEFDTENIYFPLPEPLTGNTYYFVYDSNNDGNLGDETPLAMREDGTNGDDTGGDERWTAQLNFPGGVDSSIDFGIATQTADIVYPGGVGTDLVMWLSADNGVTNAGNATDATAWIDRIYGILFNHAEIAASTFPTYYSNLMNGNPGLDWDNDTDRLAVGPLAFGTIPETDLFVSVVYSRLIGANGEDLFQYSSGNVVEGGDDDLRISVEGDGSIDTWVDSGASSTGNVSSNDGFIHMATVARSGSTHSTVFDGEFQLSRVESQLIINGGCLVIGGHSNVSQCDTFVAIDNFEGDMAEMVMYDGYPSDLERLQIHSYLALKYGIHMGDDTDGNTTPQEVISGSVTEGDYVASDGSTIFFDVSDNGSYVNNIAGIARDDDSDLSQLSSSSNTSDSVVTITSGADPGSPTGFSSNLSSLTWANEGGTAAWTATTTTESMAAPTNFSLFNRIWRAQTNGSVGTVTVELDTENANFDIPAAINNYYLIVDEDNDGFLDDETPVIMSDDGVGGGDQTGSDNIYTVNSANLGDGERFTFATSNSTPISGTVYSDEGVTTIGDGTTVEILVNGASVGSGTTSSGNFSIVPSSFPSNDDIVTFYLNTDGGANGVTVVRHDGTTGAGFDIYQDHLIVRRQTATTLSNNDLDTANNGDSDITSVYSNGQGFNLTMPGVSTLLVWPANTFTPGGTMNIRGSLNVEGTLDAAANSINVEGDVDVAGTLTHTGTLTLNGSSSQNLNLSAPRDGDLTLSGSSTRTVTLQSILNVQGNTLTLAGINDTLSLDGNNLTSTGIFSNNGTIRLQGGETLSIANQDTDSGTFEYVGNGTGAATTHTLFDAGATDYYNIIINDASASNQDIFQAGAALTVANDLTVTDETLDLNDQTTDVNGNVSIGAAGTIDAGASAITVSGNWSNSGTFTAGTSTLTLDASTDHNINGSSTFNNLTLRDNTNNSTDTILTLENSTTQTINGTLTLDGLDADDRLNIVSDSGGNAATFDFQSSANFIGDFLDVRDNTLLDNSSGVTLPLNPANSINSGNTTGWFPAPTITDSNISIAGGGGTGGAYIIGNTVTVTWDNSVATGDGNTNLTESPEADLSGFGGSATETMTDTTACGGTAADDIWEACYTLVAGLIDATNVNASISATNATGTTGPIADTSNATVDNQAPNITDNGTLTITTDNGVADVAALNNGTSNQDQVTQSAVLLVVDDDDTATIDLTDLTGQGALPAGVESGDVIAGALDNAAQTFTITVRDNAGNITTTSSDAISVDNQVPTVADGAISSTIDDDAGIAGVGEVGEHITTTWSNVTDSNTDTLSSVQVDLSQFGGGTENMLDDGVVPDAGVDDVYTNRYTIAGGNGSDLNATVLVTDNAGNITSTADTDSDITINTNAPVVTDGNININTGTGTGNAFIVGDTLVATWNNSAGGDNNAGLISITADLSDFGGGVSVNMLDDGVAPDATGGDGIYTASYTLTDGSIDIINANVSVSADNASGSTTVSDTSNVIVDNQVPAFNTLSLVISTDNGAAGIAGVGDEVTLNASLIVSDSDLITWDASPIGQGAAEANAVALSVLAGTTDVAAQSFTITATDDAGNTTISDSNTINGSTLNVDNEPLVLTDGNINSIFSVDAGVPDVGEAGDVIRITWSSGGGGDNNTDTIASVEADLSAFGGSATQTLYDDGSNGDVSVGDGVYTFDYTLPGSTFGSNLNATVTATDNGGNTTGPVSDTSNLTLSTLFPIVTDGNITANVLPVGVASIGDIITVIWDNSAGGDNNAGVTSAAADFSAFGGGTVNMLDDGVAPDLTAGDDIYTAAYTIVSGSQEALAQNVEVSASNINGSSLPVTDDSDLDVDNSPPTITDQYIISTFSVDGGVTGLGEAGDVIRTIWSSGIGGDENTDAITNVEADLSDFGGSANQTLYDDGTNGDATGGDGVYTFDLLITSASETDANASVSATDDDGNTATTGDTDSDLDIVAIPTLSFDVTSSNNAESEGSVDVTVNLSESSNSIVTVPFTVSIASTATQGAGNDYAIVTASPLTFTAGDTEETITINLNNDTIDEVTETIILRLGQPTNALLGQSIERTINLIDDDVGTGPTASASWRGFFSENSNNNGEIQGQLAVRLTGETFANAGGTLSIGTDYTINNLPGALTESININADGSQATITLEGALADGDHNIADNISNLEITFNNDAFVGGNANAVSNISKTNLSITFIEGSGVTSNDEDGDGLPDTHEAQRFNFGDTNGDNIPDKEQANVGNIPNVATINASDGIGLEVDPNCIITSLNSGTDLNRSGYEYPLGSVDYNIDCNTTGQTVKVGAYFQSSPTENFELFKKNGASVTQVDSGDIFLGPTATKVENVDVMFVSFYVEDGDLLLDADGLVNGSIRDPFGLGAAISSTAALNNASSGSGGGGSSAILKTSPSIPTSSDNTTENSSDSSQTQEGSEENQQEATSVNFSDIEGHWAEEYITSLASQGIVKGYEDGTFRPNAPVTRAELLKLILVAFKYNIFEAGEMNFSDVGTSEWFSDFVFTALSEEIVKGYEDGTFRPHAEINRAEASKMIAISSKLVNPGNQNAAAIRFPDVNEQDWFNPHVSLLLNYTIIGGYKDGTFGPGNSLTRAEASKIISETMDIL